MESKAKKLARLEREVLAYREITPYLGSCFRTNWKNLTSRDFYRRLHDKVDGCILCKTEVERGENGSKKLTHKNTCALVVLGIVPPGVIIIDW